MQRCKKNILYIFGFFLVMAIFGFPIFNEILLNKAFRIDVELIIAEIFVIIFIGSLAYILFCVLPQKFRMKKGMKEENTHLFFGWLLIMINISVWIITILKISANNILYMVIIGILLSATSLYVIWVHRLIKGKKAFLADKRKDVNLAERKLIDFYFPLKLKLNILYSYIADFDLSEGPMIDVANEIVGLVSKYEHMLNKETNQAFLELLEFITKFEHIKDDELEEWKTKALEKAGEVIKLSNKEIVSLKSEIDRAHRSSIYGMQRRKKVSRKGQYIRKKNILKILTSMPILF